MNQPCEGDGFTLHKDAQMLLCEKIRKPEAHNWARAVYCLYPVSSCYRNGGKSRLNTQDKTAACQPLRRDVYARSVQFR